MLTKARAAINKAQSHLHRVQSSSFDPSDAEAAVMFAFYAYENAVVAVAEARSIPWKKNHYDKADLASRLAADGVVTRDVGDLLRHLNEARKDVSYGEFIEEVERLVSDAEED